MFDLHASPSHLPWIILVQLFHRSADFASLLHGPDTHKCKFGRSWDNLQRLVCTKVYTYQNNACKIIFRKKTGTIPFSATSYRAKRVQRETWSLMLDKQLCLRGYPKCLGTHSWSDRGGCTSEKRFGGRGGCMRHFGRQGAGGRWGDVILHQ